MSGVFSCVTSSAAANDRSSKEMPLTEKSSPKVETFVSMIFYQKNRSFKALLSSIFYSINKAVSTIPAGLKM
jgi:hypothetical protein